MNAHHIIDVLADNGIRCWADGNAIRFQPAEKIDPEAARWLRDHKPQLLAALRGDVADPVVHHPAQHHHVDPDAPRCDRCGSTSTIDVMIHNGDSTRRDCGRCGRFLDFPRWHGHGIGEPAPQGT